MAVRAPSFRVAQALTFALAAVLGGERDVHAEAWAEAGTDLVAVARSSGRPPECGGGARLRASRWERARSPGLARYCDALARGYVALEETPKAASKSAAAAEAALPGHAAPLVLSARADVARGAYADAYAKFERARASSPQSLDAPRTLHDAAIAALVTGHPRPALLAYRALVPRAELMGDRREELAVLAEAAALVMNEEKALGEALGYLTEARRRGTLPGIGDAVSALLVLALSRAGRTGEASATAALAPGPWWLEGERQLLAGGKPSLLPALPEGELHAMIAIVAERTDPALALERWQSYLLTPAGKTGPFAVHARAHRDALLRGRASRP